MEFVDFNYNAKENLAQLYPVGAFLTAGHQEKANTMTIGWGNIGISWSKPVFIALVAKSRYTHELIERFKEFTVTFPYEDKREELTVVGTNSGRNVDKYALSKLKLKPGVILQTPHIDCLGMTYECKVIYHNDVHAENLDSEIHEKRYGKTHDYHTFFFGEIVSAYRTEGND